MSAVALLPVIATAEVAIAQACPGDSTHRYPQLPGVVAEALYVGGLLTTVTEPELAALLAIRDAADKAQRVSSLDGQEGADRELRRALQRYDEVKR